VADYASINHEARGLGSHSSSEDAQNMGEPFEPDDPKAAVQARCGAVTDISGDLRLACGVVDVR
jgi:hypothetical protein